MKFNRHPWGDWRTQARIRLGVALAAVLLLACLPSPAATIYSFDFDNDTLGQTTSFTDVSHGLAATFEDAGAVEGSFMVLPSVFSTLNGNALYSLLPDGILRITFSQDLTDLSLAFALGSTGVMLVQAFDAGVELVSATSTVGAVDEGGAAYEGGVSVSVPDGFRGVEISSTSTAGFAIDNIEPAPKPGMLEPVPEPGTLIQFGTGLSLLVVALVRRK